VRRGGVGPCVSKRALPAIRGPPGRAAAPLWRGIPEKKIVVKEKSKIHLPALALIPPGSCSGTRSGVKMGALEELDDPSALQPEREVTEHPSQ
jgi:hypothetical protein